MSSSETAACCLRSCSQPAAGVGPYSCLRLCSHHLNVDTEKAKEQQVKLRSRLRLVREPLDRQQALTTNLQVLTAQIERVLATFDAVQDKLHQWKDIAASRVKEEHDSVARRLSDAAEAEDCEKEISLAYDTGDLRKVVELAASMDLWVEEASDRLTEFKRMRSIGNVSAGVQQLNHVIDRHMTSVMQKLHPMAVIDRRSAADVTRPQLYPVIDKHLSDAMSQIHLDDRWMRATVPPVCRSVATIGGLRFEPYHVTLCSNTAGFASDSSGRLVREDLSAVDHSPLPQSCVFASFEPECTKYLLVTSLDGSARLRFNCGVLDWTNWINGLHCDSARQQVFVAQADAVTVTDLSGCAAMVINAGSLRQSIGWISGLVGNEDKLFLLDTKEKKLLSIWKESGKLESVISVSQFNSGGLHELGLHGSTLLMVESKSGEVHRLNLCEPTQNVESLKGFVYPWKVAVDSGGLVFVTEFGYHTVRVLTSGGVTLQTLGTPGQRGSDDGSFDRPIGVSVAEMNGSRLLVVADSGNCRLRVYELL